MRAGPALRHVSRVAAGVVAMGCAVFAIGPAPASLQSAPDAIRAAIIARLGAVGLGAEVTVISIDVSVPGATVREARPDPSARLGRPIKFTLVRATGLPVIVVATVRVVADRAVALRALGRNEVLGAADVIAVHEELRDVPLRALPVASLLVGGRVLRPVAANATILPGTVVVRRAIEPGDRVTVVAASGDIEVTAEMVASDGGAIGDVIRVMNPETRRYLRGRIVRAGLVELKAAEVQHER